MYHVALSAFRKSAVNLTGVALRLNTLHPHAHKIQPHVVGRNFSTDLPTDVEYAREANEALESLSDKFSEVVEEVEEWSEADPTLADGVLTVKLGGKFGTYVINKQTPNKQLWLSSPVSGPARFDLVGGRWVYSHTKETLHELLEKELSEVAGRPLGFQECYGGE